MTSHYADDASLVQSDPNVKNPSNNLSLTKCSVNWSQPRSSESNLTDAKETNGVPF